MTFDAIAAVVAGLKVHPEPQSLPESLIDGTPVEQAAAYNRFKEIAAVANGLAKATAEALAAQIPNGALRYGEQIMRPSGKGSVRLNDPGTFWDLVAEVTADKTVLEAGACLAALCPPNIRTTALPRLLKDSGYSLEAVRGTFLSYDPPSSPLSVMPLHKAPQWAQKLSEGQISTRKVDDATTVT